MYLPGLKYNSITLLLLSSSALNINTTLFLNIHNHDSQDLPSCPNIVLYINSFSQYRICYNLIHLGFLCVKLLF